MRTRISIYLIEMLNSTNPIELVAYGREHADAGVAGWRTMRRVPIAVLSAVALFCAGCGSSSTSSASNTAAGLGATNAVWDSAHTADHKFAPGIVYDADSSVSSGVEYSAVVHQNGYVLSYDYSFTNRPVAAAKARVLESQFPPGAKVVWFLSKRTCAQMLVHSATLGKELGVKSVGDPTGTAFVEFLSGPTDNSYNPSSVNEASLQSFPPTRRSHSPGC
jgi:hypothetical protein